MCKLKLSHLPTYLQVCTYTLPSLRLLQILIAIPEIQFHVLQGYFPSNYILSCIFNFSLSTRLFPFAYKHAHITLRSFFLSFSWPDFSPPATTVFLSYFLQQNSLKWYSVNSNFSSPIFSWTHQLGFSFQLCHWNSSFQSHQWSKHHTFQVLSLLSTHSKFLLLISFLPNLKMLESPRAQSLVPFCLSTFILYFLTWS